MKKLALIIGLALSAHATVLEITNGGFDTGLGGWTVDGSAEWIDGHAVGYGTTLLYQTVDVGGAIGDWEISYDFGGNPIGTFYVWLQRNSEPWENPHAEQKVGDGGHGAFTLALDGEQSITFQFNIFGDTWLDNVSTKFTPANPFPGPEPSSSLLVSAALGLLAFRRSR